MTVAIRKIAGTDRGVLLNADLGSLCLPIHTDHS